MDPGHRHAELYARHRYSSHYLRWLSPETIETVEREAADYVLDERRPEFILQPPAWIGRDRRFLDGYREAARFDWQGEAKYRMYRRKR